MRTAAIVFAILTALLLHPQPPACAAELTGTALVDALRSGGFNLYFRHAATDWSQQDRVTVVDDWLSCDPTRIRQLSDPGRDAARDENAFIALEIVNEVLASPYCRTMDTARLLGLGEVRPSNDVINLRVASYFGGREQVIATARRLLGTATVAGGNRVIVAHGNVARDATPVYPNEAEAIVFRPDGRGGFTVVGRLSAAMWRALADGRP